MMKLTPGDRFHQLAQRAGASICAVVVLSHGNYRLFYLHNDADDSSLFGNGFRLAGVIGLVKGKIEIEAAPGDETAYVMKLARADFERALAVSDTGDAA